MVRLYRATPQAALLGKGQAPLHPPAACAAPRPSPPAVAKTTRRGSPADGAGAGLRFLGQRTPPPGRHPYHGSAERARRQFRGSNRPGLRARSTPGWR
jgi:hypothetical protein